MWQLKGWSRATADRASKEAFVGDVGVLEVFGQKFESDFPVQPGVFSKVDFPHPAFTQLIDDLVMRDSPAYHCPVLVLLSLRNR